MNGIELLSPIEAPTAVTAGVAPRLESLEGTTIALLENTKDNSRQMLDAIGRILQRDHGVAALVRRSKQSSSFPPADDVYDEIARMTDAVITGVGD